MSTDTMNFSADMSRLLDIVANALYTNQDVFLRELISNAADACDRLRYDAIQTPDLTADNPNFRIHIYKDTDQRTLTIVDNGIGMSRKELIDNLGTIAKSGTAALMDKLKNKQEGDPLKLIGQFGVGFYACFMVADRVTVVSRKAGQKSAHQWVSDGHSGFDVSKAAPENTKILDGSRGTAITLHLKDEGSEFLLDEKIKQTVSQYSDHIDVKIFLNTPEETEKGEGQPINTASALWARSKSEITDEQYTEFYRTLTHGFDEPLLTAHWRAEGKIEFTALLFIPTMRPWDLYDSSRQSSLRLYVRRVFISDKVEGLTYPWLRFIRGVIDSEDLPLNISRETLQYNPVITKIRSSVARRVLGDLHKLSQSDEPAFLTFWGQFGAALKEGLYDAAEHREDIFKICRFYSTHGETDQMVSLDDYIDRMKDGQKEIYYMSGENLPSLKNSPQIEGFKARGLEVLFFTDTIDDFWLQQAADYEGKAFKSVTKGDINWDEDENNDDNKHESSAETQDLLVRLKDILEDYVEDVRPSKRLAESPVCLVASEHGVDMHMERVLKINQQYQGGQKPILEVNVKHALIQKLAGMSDEPLQDAAHLLLDQARIVQGEPVNDAGAFVARMTKVMEKGFS